MDDTYPETYPQIQNRRPLTRPVRHFAQEEAQKERITKITMGILVTVALTIDLIEIILGVVAIGEILNSIITVAANVMFFIWFWTLGVKFTGSTKKIAVALIEPIIGLIPFLNLLPELTLGVFAIAFITRSEDKGGLLGKAASGVPGKNPNSRFSRISQTARRLRSTEIER